MLLPGFARIIIPNARDLTCIETIIPEMPVGNVPQTIWKRQANSIPKATGSGGMGKRERGGGGTKLPLNARNNNNKFIGDAG